MTISIPVDLLKAAIICCSTEETRYYLNGVYVSLSGHIVSTDGHRLFVGRLPEGTIVEKDIIIPLESVKAALKLVHRSCDTIELTDNLLGAIRFTAVDGTFPDWKRILPTGEGKEYTPAPHLAEDAPGFVQFNPSYIGDVGKIAKILTGKVTGSYVHKWTASSPAGVSFVGRDDALCVLMPIRSNHGPWAETLNAVVPQK